MVLIEIVALGWNHSWSMADVRMIRPLQETESVMAMGSSRPDGDMKRRCCHAIVSVLIDQKVVALQIFSRWAMAHEIHNSMNRNQMWIKRAPRTCWGVLLFLSYAFWSDLGHEARLKWNTAQYKNLSDSINATDHTFILTNLPWHFWPFEKRYEFLQWTL